MFLYNMKSLNQLQPQDYFQRVAISQVNKDNILSSSAVAGRIGIFSDECVFHVSGLGNNQFTCTIGPEIPKDN